MNEKYTNIVREGLWSNNVVFAQMLALCPTLAVTSTATNGLGIYGSVTAFQYHCFPYSSFGECRGAYSGSGVCRVDSYIGDIGGYELECLGA